MAKSAAERVRACEERLRKNGTASFKFYMSAELREFVDQQRGDRPAATVLRECMAKVAAWANDREAQRQMSLFEYLDYSQSLDDLLPPGLKKKVDADRGDQPLTEYLIDVLKQHHQKERKRRGRKRLSQPQ